MLNVSDPVTLPQGRAGSPSPPGMDDRPGHPFRSPRARGPHAPTSPATRAQMPAPPALQPSCPPALVSSLYLPVPSGPRALVMCPYTPYSKLHTRAFTFAPLHRSSAPICTFAPYLFLSPALMPSGPPALDSSPPALMPSSCAPILNTPYSILSYRPALSPSAIASLLSLHGSAKRRG
jgi:hypothetical protein